MKRKTVKQYLMYTNVFIVVFTMILAGIFSIKYHPIQAAVDYEGNVVQDWNFEDGGDKWNLRNKGIISQTESSDDGIYSGCVPAMQIAPNENVSGYIGQIVNVSQHEYYVLHCDAKVSIEGAKAIISVRGNNDSGPILREMIITETTWTTKEFMIDTQGYDQLLIQLVKWAEPNEDHYEATKNCDAYIDGVALAPRAANPINPNRPPVIQPTLPDKSEFVEVWRDDFNENQLDMSTWGYELGCIRGVEQQHYTNSSKNVFMRNGNLILKATNRAKEDQYMNPRGNRKVIYDSGSVRTHGKKEFLYGKIEIRAKLPKGQGVFPAFWTLGSDFTIDGDIASNQGYGWPRCGEIDIMELIGETGDDANGNKIVYGTAHTYGKDAPWEDHKLAGIAYRNPSDESFNDDYHTFGINWSKDQITWYVDDQPYVSASYANDEIAKRALNRPQYIQLNLAMGGNWPGDAGTDLDGTEFAIDYVSYSQTKQQQDEAREYYADAPKLEGTHDIEMMQGEIPDLLKNVSSTNHSYVDFSVENGLMFKVNPDRQDDNLEDDNGCTSVDLVCTGKNDVMKLASLPTGKYNLHYTAIPNDMETDESGQPNREADYKFDRQTVTLTVLERQFPSDFVLSGYEGQKLSEIELPEDWTWENSQNNLKRGENIVNVVYSKNGFTTTKTVTVTAKGVVDKTDLISMIEKAKIELKKTDVYTKKSLDHLADVINKANTVVNNYDATENDVLNAKTMLNDAIKQMEKISYNVETNDSQKENKNELKKNQSVKTGDNTMLWILWIGLIVSMLIGQKILKEK